jgi:hypothetical protein
MSCGREVSGPGDPPGPHPSMQSAAGAASRFNRRERARPKAITRNGVKEVPSLRSQGESRSLRFAAVARGKRLAGLPRPVPGSVVRTLNKGESTIDTPALAQHDSVMQLRSARDADKPEQSVGRRRALPPIQGWLLVYIVVLAFLGLHGAGLTAASIVIYAHPAAAGLHSSISLISLLFYVTTNVILILYTAVLFILMSRRLRSAIINNVIFNISSIVFLVAWHLIGDKSNVGTLVDSAPNLVSAAYILLSGRVRSTFIISRPGKAYRRARQCRP